MQVNKHEGKGKEYLGSKWVYLWENYTEEPERKEEPETNLPGVLQRTQVLLLIEKSAYEVCFFIILYTVS